MEIQEGPQRYDPPAIAERVAIGNPLIVGIYPSPRWRGDDKIED